MAKTQLLGMSQEVWRIIAENLEDADCVKLCRTCRSAMDLLQTSAYRTVYLDASASSGRSMLALSTGPRAQFVRTLQYALHGRSGELSFDVGLDLGLSDESAEALKSLRRFTGLVRFRFILSMSRVDTESGVEPRIPQHPVHMASPEPRLLMPTEWWKRLVGSSLSALSESSGAFAELEVLHLPPIPLPRLNIPVEEEKWRKIREGLTRVDIGLAWCPAFSKRITTPIPRHMAAPLSFIFLGPCPKLAHLRVIGHGAPGYHHDTIRWRKVEAPLLETLEIQNADITDELVKCLVQRTGTLKRICLRHCYGIKKERWKHLFRSIVASGTSQLVDFRVIPYPVPKRRSGETTDDYWSRWDAMLRDEGVGEYYSIPEDEYDQPWAKERRLPESQPWEEAVVHQGRVQFVMGYMMRTFRPIHAYEDLASPTVDESDIIEIWDEVQKLLERNRALQKEI